MLRFFTKMNFVQYLFRNYFVHEPDSERKTNFQDIILLALSLIMHLDQKGSFGIANCGPRRFDEVLGFFKFSQ